MNLDFVSSACTLLIPSAYNYIFSFNSDILLSPVNVFFNTECIRRVSHVLKDLTFSRKWYGVIWLPTFEGSEAFIFGCRHCSGQIVRWHYV